jgi:hypothetical protein
LEICLVVILPKGDRLYKTKGRAAGEPCLLSNATGQFNPVKTKKDYPSSGQPLLEYQQVIY